MISRRFSNKELKYAGPIKSPSCLLAPQGYPDVMTRYRFGRHQLFEIFTQPLPHCYSTQSKSPKQVVRFPIPNQLTFQVRGPCLQDRLLDKGIEDEGIRNCLFKFGWWEFFSAYDNHWLHLCRAHHCCRERTSHITPTKGNKDKRRKTKNFFGVGLILESPKGLVFIMLVDTQTFRESLMESFGSFVGGESEF